MKRFFGLAVLMLTASAWAVAPSTWSHSTESDFTAGKLDKVAVNNQGEVTLARAMESLVAPAEKTGMVSAITVSPRGKVYIATSPNGKVFKVEEGKLVPFAELPGVLVRAMIYDNDGLVAGVSGKEAGLYRIDGEGKVKAIWKDPKVTFVWAVVAAGGDSYYVATGPTGNVYRVEADGKAAVIYHSQDKNILSLIAGAEGMLYAGTGETGLILEINIEKKAGRVLYDAAEKEVSSLVLDSDGTLFAATSDSSKAASSSPMHEGSGGHSKLSKLLKAISGPPTEPPPDEGNGDDEGGVEGDESSSSPASKPAKLDESPGESSETQAAGDDEPEEDQEPASPPATHSGGLLGRMAGLHMPSGAGSVESGSGNAVYRIEKDGCVRTIFRKSVSILAMAEHEKMLTLATGHSGQLYVVDPSGQHSSLLAAVDPKDVVTLLGDGQGKLYVGTANQGGLFVLSGQSTPKGTLVSKALDASQISRWGSVSVRADVPAGSGATIATRSGNVAKPDDATWSPWSDELAIGANWTKIPSPAGRYLQYRLTLSGDGKAAPLVEQVQLSYQVHNLAPQIRSAGIQPAAQGQSMPMGASKIAHRSSAMMSEAQTSPEPLRVRSVSVHASDANNDDLEYAFFFRRGSDEKWIKLADKLTDPTYAWDTLGVQDGVYEMKIEVSDAKSNPPGTALMAEKILRGILVDNTAPAVSELACKPAGKGKATLSGSVADATSRIGQIAYAVDNNDQWITILPTSGICDCLQESFSLTIDLPDSGRHRVAVRTMDEFNNAGYSSVEVNVP